MSTLGGRCGTRMTASVVSSVFVALWKKAISTYGPMPAKADDALCSVYHNTVNAVSHWATMVAQFCLPVLCVSL